jgi:hypothetical protein
VATRQICRRRSGYRRLEHRIVLRSAACYSAPLLLPSIHRPVRFAALTFALGTLLTAGACSEEGQAEYNIKLLAVPGQTPLATATSVTLEAVGTGMQSTVPVTPGQVPALSLSKIDPRKTGAATFVVKVNGPQGLIAYGQSPRIRLVRATGDLFITIQSPSSLAPISTTPLIPALADGAVITALAGEPNDPHPIAVPLFLGGRTIDPANDTEQSTRWIGLFNPYLNVAAVPNLLTPTAMGAVVWPRNDGKVWSFGGKTDVAPFVYGGIASELGTSQTLSSIDFGIVANYGSNDSVGIRRSSAVIAEKDNVMYAFGGENADSPDKSTTVLASVVEITPTATPDKRVRLGLLPMLAPRIGHSATAVSVALPMPHTEVLLFGGTGTAAPVAEVMTEGTFVALGSEAGPSRSGHTVVPLRDGRLLVLGGVGTDGAPLTDARFYDPVTRSFALAPLQLQTPRVGAAIFGVGNDLVVCGGADLAGMPVASAERFDLDTLVPLPSLPAAARSGAKVAYLPDGTAILVGGRSFEPKGRRPTSLIEVYRPRDLPVILP